MTGQSSFFNFYKAAEKPPEREPFWIIRLFQRVLAMLGITLLMHLAIAGFLANGVDIIESAIRTESEYLGLDDGSRASQFLLGTAHTVHDWLFLRSGLIEAVRSADTSIATAVWPLLTGVILGVQLFVIRVGVLVLMSPLIAMGMVVAGLDGIAAWYIRRAGAGRESAFIYHRAKRLVGWSLFGLWGLYLLPPIAIDPRWVLPPFLGLLALAVRVTAQSFKKYI